CDDCVPLLCLPCADSISPLKTASPSLSSFPSIRGSFSRALRRAPPGFSCKSAADGLYLIPRAPILQGNLSKKPKKDELGITVGSVLSSLGSTELLRRPP